MKRKYLLANTIGIIVLINSIVAISVAGCSSKKNEPVPRTKTDTLARVWVAKQLELGNTVNTLNVMSFNVSIPADNLTFSKSTYTWGADNGSWSFNDDKTAIQFTSAVSSSSFTGNMIVLSRVALILQFSGTYYYYTNSTPSTIYNIKRITFN